MYILNDSIDEPINSHIRSVLGGRMQPEIKLLLAFSLEPPYFTSDNFFFSLFLFWTLFMVLLGFSLIN